MVVTCEVLVVVEVATAEVVWLEVVFVLGGIVTLVIIGAATVVVEIAVVVEEVADNEDEGGLLVAKPSEGLIDVDEPVAEELPAIRFDAFNAGFS